MTARRPRISIVVPVFNEEAVLPAFRRALMTALAPLRDDLRLEVIYVDDGSTDATLAIVRDWAASDADVRYLSLTRNFGHQAALSAGLAAARGAAVITLDGDLQHPPDLIPELIEHWQAGWDVVQTVRADDPTLGWFKRGSSWLFYRLLRLTSGLDVPPAGADFRLLSRRSVDALLQLPDRQRCLRGLIAWLGYPTAMVPFIPAARAAGQSKYSLARMFMLACDGLFAFSAMPLRASLAFGIGLLTLSAALTTTLAVIGNTGVALLFAVHLIGLAVMTILAVMGEAVARLTEQTRGRPLYVIKESSPPRRRRPCPVVTDQLS